MKIFLLFLIAVESAFCAPLVHLGQGLVLSADYRFSQMQDGNPICQYYQTSIKIDPTYGTGYTEWYVYKNDGVSVIFEDQFPIQNSFSTTVVWNDISVFFPDPVYSISSVAWITNMWCAVWPASMGPEWPDVFPQASAVDIPITPYDQGDIWIWKKGAKILMEKGSKPKGFK